MVFPQCQLCSPRSYFMKDKHHRKTIRTIFSDEVLSNPIDNLNHLRGDNPWSSGNIAGRFIRIHRIYFFRWVNCPIATVTKVTKPRKSNFAFLHGHTWISNRSLERRVIEKVVRKDRWIDGAKLGATYTEVYIQKCVLHAYISTTLMDPQDVRVLYWVAGACPDFPLQGKWSSVECTTIHQLRAHEVSLDAKPICPTICATYQ